MKGRIPLTPLSAAERCFAADHFGVIHQYLCYQKLDEDDWFDIVCFGYLQAVKKWHIRKDLHRYAFSTVAFQSISLDQVLEGTDGRTLMDTITRDNLDFICYTGGNNEYQL